MNGEQQARVPRPYIRKVRLFTRGKHPEIDSLKICYDLLTEMPEHVRVATLNFIANKFGYRLYDKLRGRFT